MSPPPVKLLVEAGADPECLSTAGWRPQEEAIATGSREIAAYLMKVRCCCVVMLVFVVVCSVFDGYVP